MSSIESEWKNSEKFPLRGLFCPKTAILAVLARLPVISLQVTQATLQSPKPTPCPLPPNILVTAVTQPPRRNDTRNTFGCKKERPLALKIRQNAFPTGTLPRTPLRQLMTLLQTSLSAGGGDTPAVTTSSYSAQMSAPRFSCLMRSPLGAFGASVWEGALPPPAIFFLWNYACDHGLRFST